MKPSLWTAGAALPQRRTRGWPILLALLSLLMMLASPAAHAQGPQTAPLHPGASKAEDGWGDVPPGYVLIEGDILVPEDEYRQYGLRSAFKSTDVLWTGGIVPYFFDPGVSAQHQLDMRQAMNDWEAVAAVHFVPISGPAGTFWVRIQNGSGNNSAVGMKWWGQVINIANWEEFKMVHELGHCPGLVHEHERPDQATYVSINWDNIQTDFQFAFGLIDNAGWIGPYDFDSVMHYDQCAFSNDCPYGGSCNCTHTTITALPPNQSWQTVMGQRTHLSYWDKIGMSFLYAPAGWRWLNAGYTGTDQDGSLFTPWVSLSQAIYYMPAEGGTLWVWPGNYPEAVTLDKPMTLRGVGGTATLGQ